MVEIPTVEDLKRVEDKQDRLEKMMLLIIFNNSFKKVVNVADIAHMEGVSKSKLYTDGRYLLPRFGQSAYPEGFARWPLDEYLAWSSRDSMERQREFQQHLDAERKRSAS